MTICSDGSGFFLGQRVEIDDGRTLATGSYAGTTEAGLARVRDEDTDLVMVGSIDFVCPA